MTTPPLLAVDAPGLYFRAFHGIPTTAAVAADGTPVNAVRGFLDMLTTLIRERRPDRLVCAWDTDWRPDWRVALLSSYKAHRVAPDGGEQVPAELVPQVRIIGELLAACGIATFGAAGYEADDVLGTVAATRPPPVEVVSGDRDLIQLVDDAAGVRLLYTGQGVAKLAVYDEAAVRGRYGVPPSAYVDLAVLRGDPSDGLPGVSGVGDKTAARLVDRYGDLPGILTALDDPAGGFAPGLRTRLADAREYLAVAPRVVRVVRDVPLPAADLTVPAEPADPELLTALARQWSVVNPCRRLLAALADGPGGSATTPVSDDGSHRSAGSGSAGWSAG